jgi:hypothetical protein
MRCLTELTEQTELPGRGVLLACRSALGLVAQKAVAPLAAPASLWLADASRFAAKTNQRVLVCGEGERQDPKRSLERVTKVRRARPRVSWLAGE